MNTPGGSAGSGALAVDESDELAELGANFSTTVLSSSISHGSSCTRLLVPSPKPNAFGNCRNVGWMATFELAIFSGLSDATAMVSAGRYELSNVGSILSVKLAVVASADLFPNAGSAARAARAGPRRPETVKPTTARVTNSAIGQIPAGGRTKTIRCLCSISILLMSVPRVGKNGRPAHNGRESSCASAMCASTVT